MARKDEPKAPTVEELAEVGSAYTADELAAGVETLSKFGEYNADTASRMLRDPETGLATVELADGAHGVGISPAIAARICEDHPEISGYGDDGFHGVWVATMSHHFHRYQYVDGAGVLHFRQ